MQIIKVLSRKDAYSLLLAIVLAMSIQGLLSFTYSLSNDWLISDPNFGQGPGWEFIYGTPALSAAMQLVVIELFLWLVVLLKKVVRPVRAKK